MNIMLLSGTDKSPLIPGNKVSFSSYPSMLFSGDDFHVLGSQLVCGLFFVLEYIVINRSFFMDK